MSKLNDYLEMVKNNSNSSTLDQYSNKCLQYIHTELTRGDWPSKNTQNDQYVKMHIEKIMDDVFFDEDFDEKFKTDESHNIIKQIFPKIKKVAISMVNDYFKLPEDDSKYDAARKQWDEKYGQYKEN